MEYEIQVSHIEPQPVATIRTTTPPTEIGTTLASILPEVGRYVERVAARRVGAPFARYYVYERGAVDLEGGFAVATPVRGEGRVRGGELPGGTVVSTRHFGPYTKLFRAWKALETWMTENGREGAGAGWEVYVTDPGDEPDETKWETLVIVPIR